MVIRTLDPSECAAFWAIRLTALQESPDAFGSTYEEEVALSPEAKHARCQWTPENFVVGAFDSDGRLVGIAGFRREDRTKNRHKGSVYGMYVEPEFRGKGVGRALLTEALRLIRQLPGVERVLIDAVAGNAAAESLYESFGFVTFGREPDSKRHDGRSYDMLRMSLLLD